MLTIISYFIPVDHGFPIGNKRPVVTVDQHYYFCSSVSHYVYGRTTAATQYETRLGVPSIAGRLLKVIETCVYDLSLQTHTPLHYILGLSSQPLTPAKR